MKTQDKKLKKEIDELTQAISDLKRTYPDEIKFSENLRSNIEGLEHTIHKDAHRRRIHEEKAMAIFTELFMTHVGSSPDEMASRFRLYQKDTSEESTSKANCVLWREISKIMKALDVPLTFHTFHFPSPRKMCSILFKYCSFFEYGKTITKDLVATRETLEKDAQLSKKTKLEIIKTKAAIEKFREKEEEEQEEIAEIDDRIFSCTKEIQRRQQDIELDTKEYSKVQMLVQLIQNSKREPQSILDALEESIKVIESEIVSGGESLIKRGDELEKDCVQLSKKEADLRYRLKTYESIDAELSTVSSELAKTDEMFHRIKEGKKEEEQEEIAEIDDRIFSCTKEIQRRQQDIELDTKEYSKVQMLVQLIQNSKREPQSILDALEESIKVIESEIVSGGESLIKRGDELEKDCVQLSKKEADLRYRLKTYESIDAELSTVSSELAKTDEMFHRIKEGKKVEELILDTEIEIERLDCEVSLRDTKYIPQIDHGEIDQLIRGFETNTREFDEKTQCDDEIAHQKLDLEDKISVFEDSIKSRKTQIEKYKRANETSKEEAKENKKRLRARLDKEEKDYDRFIANLKSALDPESFPKEEEE
ncbi:hypothetical protein ADUPG1_009992 [Aduncisulcus paluster]|uniref:Uncharacterized protein n=1 Tax=Aduncisulcus paluster TaxID=2918883 RepID=A0ABQ5KXI3_9EUKA|nr:hypothetical protein ADUPG1_009992 [Aduncisulcus paluster]